MSDQRSFPDVDEAQLAAAARAFEALGGDVDRIHRQLESVAAEAASTLDEGGRDGIDGGLADLRAARGVLDRLGALLAATSRTLADRRDDHLRASAGTSVVATVADPGADPSSAGDATEADTVLAACARSMADLRGELR